MTTDARPPLAAHDPARREQLLGRLRTARWVLASLSALVAHSGVRDLSRPALLLGSRDRPGPRA